MAPVLRQTLLVLALLAAALVFVFYGNMRSNTDFIAMYGAVHGVVNGVSPYDELGQSALLNAEYPDLEEPIALLPFALLPWYVLVLSPLGWLSPHEAGRAFMLFNAGCMVAAAWALSARRGHLTPWLGLAVSLYFPVIGLVTIGQYTLPVYVGGALGLLGLSRKQPWLIAMALLLLSFKWHIGLIPAGVLVALTLRDRNLATRALAPTLAVFGVGGLLGLLLDPVWPASFVRSVLALSAAEVNQVCDTCASLSWTLSQWTGLRAAIPGAGLLAAGCLVVVARGLHRDAVGAFAAMWSVSLLALPYVRNYDYAVLALALYVAAERSRTTAERGLVALVWLASAVILIDRTMADDVLGTSALVLVALLVAQGPQPTEADTASA